MLIFNVQGTLFIAKSTLQNEVFNQSMFFLKIVGRNNISGMFMLLKTERG